MTEQPPRFVITRDIKAAVSGRETDVLDALGIDWRRCTHSNHIRCPYPEHGSDGDNWRWDARKAKAFCSCQTGHADGVLDVVMKCEGVDLEGAKLRIAEMIGRSDLIKTKGGKGGQRMDAVSLMNPPADMLDVGLPQAYLGHRLGIASAEVLMPTTASVGWKELTYWDPPSKQGGKPVEVGQFAATAFSTVAADGGMHCHRIYVAPNGAGKADVGTGQNGKERDPKKSAKAPVDGASTAGRSVIWGSTGTASHVIVTEGIETGAAVAHACRREVEAGEIAVAAAISAGGVSAWQPWPATRRVTIAADRDEKRKPSRPDPTRAGERAAREFGLRCQDEGSALDVRIALPGAPGTATDWLDVLLADGVDVVRVGIEAALLFAPTAAEMQVRVDRAGRDAEIAAVTAAYPIPTLNSASLCYAHAEDGHVWLHKFIKKGKGENAEIVMVPACSPICIVSRLRREGQIESYGIRVALRDMGGHRRIVDLERGDLAKVGAAEARTALFANGLRTENNGEQLAVELLKAALPQNEIAVVRKTGWHGLDGDGFFACPNGTIIGAPGGAYELQAEARVSPRVARGGTFEGWKAAVSVAASVPGCEHFTIGIIAGFVGPILSLCGFDTCGVNFSGKTSLGKTTGQRLAVSTWSRPDSTKKDSLLQSARATANSMEAGAARSNGTVMVLDELGHITGTEVGKIIYLLASGVGKARMTASATMRDSYSWSTFALLSAEASLEEKIRSDGEAMKGGQAARFPDIDVTGVNGQVSRTTLEKIDAVQIHYGHAGPAFVEALIRDGKHKIASNIREAVATIASRLAARKDADDKKKGDGMLDGGLVRAAQPFALMYIAGGMARDYGILPSNVDVAGAVTWAWDRFRSSNEAVALDPEKQAVMNIRRWVAERWNTSIHWLEATDRPIRDALAWWDDNAVYIPDARICEAAGGALKENQIAKVLSEAGFIAKRKSPTHSFISYVPRVGPLKAYALSRKHFGRNSEEPDTLKVVNGGLL